MSIMNKNIALICIAVIAVACNNHQEQKINPAESMTIKQYPETYKSDHEDEYFGHSITDPYHWLEDDLSDETKKWVSAQNEVTFDYLSQIPYREAIRKRLQKLWNYEKYTAPFVRGDYTYFFKNDGLQNQSVLYRMKNGEEEVFLDPNKFSEDGTSSLAGISFSKDGSLVAYQISEGGSDWTSVVVMDTESKSLVGDTLKDVKFSGLAWKGTEGFYYSSYDKPEKGSVLSGMTDMHKLYFHALNTSQSEDSLEFGGMGFKRRYINAGLTEDERFLVVTAANATSGNELFIKDLEDPEAQFVTIVGDFEQNHTVIDNDGDKLFIYTDLDAPNGKVVSVHFNNPTSENWEDLIPESEDVLSPSIGGGKIFASYLQDAVSLIKQYDKNGNMEREIKLPGKGTVSGFSAKKEAEDLYYTFTSYIDPGTIYKYNIENGKSEMYKEAEIQFDLSEYESKQVFYESKDGTKIPMMITYKKGIERDGTNPTLLYGYGGFNISLTPSFSISNIILLEQGGIYAVPNLRGGGEYGQNWHLAGTKMQKQNVFDDFIAAAEYLVSENYTSSENLAIAGGSNGGLLVGASMTQRPDLFKVALPAVGVLDMLRYHKFTAGAGWAYDYGTSDDSEEMFEYLYNYSPYHALKEETEYPATMVTTADHDDRVVPAHSFKFAARLQEYHSGDNPVLIRIDTKAGHGAGKSTEMVIEEQTDKWAFMFQNIGIDYTVTE